MVSPWMGMGDARRWVSGMWLWLVLLGAVHRVALGMALHYGQNNEGDFPREIHKRDLPASGNIFDPTFNLPPPFAFDPQYQIRLVDGQNRCEGRLEILYNNIWGTVCDDKWDMADSSVVCRQLQCGRPIMPRRTTQFGNGGKGQILMDNVECTGFEPELALCLKEGWGFHNCDHQEDVGVFCEVSDPRGKDFGDFTTPWPIFIGNGVSEGDIRLANGTHGCEGRVEIFHNGVWGTVCDDRWTLVNSRVVCRQLQCGEAEIAHTNSHFGYGTGVIQMDNVECGGNEDKLGTCKHLGWELHNCGHHEDAGVTCALPPTAQPGGIGTTASATNKVTVTNNENTPTPPPTIPSSSSASPRFSTNTNSIITPTPTPATTSEPAAIVSTTPGNPSTTGSTATINPSTEASTTNNPTTVTSATTNNPTIALTAANPTEIASTTDDPTTIASSTNGPTTITSATMASTPVTPATIASTTDNPMTIASTTDNPTTIASTTDNPMTIASNTDNPTTIASTIDNPTTIASTTDNPTTIASTTDNPTTIASTTDNPTTIASNTDNPTTIASSTDNPTTIASTTDNPTTIASSTDNPTTISKTTNNPTTIASTTDSPTTITYMTHNPTTIASTTINPTTIDSTMSNPTTRAPTTPSDSTTTIASAAATSATTSAYATTGANGGNREFQVSTSSTSTMITTLATTVKQPAPIRLVGGGDLCSGRLEIMYINLWGTVCDDYPWGMRNAEVVCRQLGCGPPLNATSEAFFGTGSGPILMDNVDCHGDEAGLSECFYPGWGVHNCVHNEDAGVICSPPTTTPSPAITSAHEAVVRNLALPEEHPTEQVTTAPPTTVPPSETLRLVGGNHTCEGRVEVYLDDLWGTVCDDAWDLLDAQVVCRQVRCGEAVEATQQSKFGAGTGRIQMDNLKCSGLEANLFDCSHITWNVHNCDHSEDAGVICLKL